MTIPERVVFTRIDHVVVTYFLSSCKSSWRQRLCWFILAHEEQYSSAASGCGTSKETRCAP
jgi:hypothetical protein